MHSLLAWERESVIGPLRSLLVGTHPGLALAARLALQDLADHDDSMKVREAAHDALAAAPVAVETTTIAPPPEDRVAEGSTASSMLPKAGSIAR